MRSIALRNDLNDGENFRPPEIRTDLLKLHELAMAVVNNGALGQAAEMFDLAMDLEGQVSHMMTELQQVQDTLSELVSLYPESLADAALDRCRVIECPGGRVNATPGAARRFLAVRKRRYVAWMRLDVESRDISLQ
jgi:hypothetical protein